MTQSEKTQMAAGDLARAAHFAGFGGNDLPPETLEKANTGTALSRAAGYFGLGDPDTDPSQKPTKRSIFGNWATPKAAGLAR